jgi:branched-chain amino acid transport system permease protein
MWQSTLDFALIYGLFGLSTYVALSVGLLSVASVVFGAIGGFAYASLSVDHGFGLWESLLVAAVLGGLSAYALSWLFIRLSSDYFAVATIALVLIAYVVIINLSITGGASGRAVPQRGGTLHEILVVAIVAFVLARLRRSRFGLASESVREDLQVASSVGINVRAIQRVGFTISGVIGALAGVLLADALQYINQGTFSTDLALVMLAAVVLGGAFHWFGAVVGAIIFQYIPALLQGSLGTYQQAVTGVILVIIMIYLPKGVVDQQRWREVGVKLWSSRPRAGAR